MIWRILHRLFGWDYAYVVLPTRHGAGGAVYRVARAADGRRFAILADQYLIFEDDPQVLAFVQLTGGRA